MKLSEFRKASEVYTGKASDIIRQLIIAGIAIIWLFKSTDKGQDVIDSFLMLPLISLCLAAVADLLQYLIGGMIWDRFFLNEERKVKIKQLDDPTTASDPDIKAPKKFSDLLYRFYWTKVGLMLISYLLITIYLFRHLKFK